MKLFELEEGQKFRFLDKLKGKTFKVDYKEKRSLMIEELKTGKRKRVYNYTVTYSREVETIEGSRAVVIDDEEGDQLLEILHEAYKLSAENGEPEEVRSRINKLYKKIKG